MNVGIIGGGVVGAAIAYRLSKMPGVAIHVCERNPPQRLESTGAALGVLAAVISSKLKGKHLKLRLESLRLYEALIPELMERTGLDIPYNRHGILQLFFDAEDFERWSKTKAVRQQQGFTLECWPRETLVERFPELAAARSRDTGAIAVGAVYSPQDRQLDPTALTRSLIRGAIQNGAQFHFNTVATDFCVEAVQTRQRVARLCTSQDAIPVDWVVIAAGLGSAALTQSLAQPIQIRPVLGQALHLHCPQVLRPDSPVIDGRDVHLVPLSRDELWVGATVEFPDEKAVLEPNPADLERVRQQAIALYPALADAEILRTWHGLRPRPDERAAPVIEQLPGYQNVLIATGHYRNGVLLAPVTAEKIRAYLEAAM
ncbi:NAD(P)/FAD-dependent oxidoreductase [Altericista sp. CCNU0014]|uniref:NAD(P)/FAD-dependent oxidoreductase n=1 Tax=Altericista sp. CCNU0014 TaxID=3082949 RepID=UPI00384B4678